MRRTILFGASALARFTSAQSTASDTIETDSRVEACHPEGDASAPCNQIAIIEQACMVRGISMSDHQRCMCEGSYFEDWAGCRQCLQLKGALGDGGVQYWVSLMEQASSSLCDSGATPTTWLQDIFASQQENATPGADPSSTEDASTSVTDTEIPVSRYYTVPDDQGPGITPTAAAETDTETQTSSEASETETETGSGQGNDDDDDDDGDGDDDDDAAGRIYAQGAAVAAMGMAGAALFLVM